MYNENPVPIKFGNDINPAIILSYSGLQACVAIPGQRIPEVPNI